MAKRILGILVVLMVVVCAASPLHAIGTASAASVARKTLLELFTATWCGPCAAYGPNADKAYDALGQQHVILLRDQVWQDNLDTDETNARCIFYGVNGVPSLHVNGMYSYHPANYADYMQKINSMNSTAPLFQIGVSAQVQTTTNQGAAVIEVKSLTGRDYTNLRLVVALYEKVVAYEGTNKEKTHRFVVRDYLFDEMGEKVELAGLQTRHFSYPLSLRSGSNPGDFGIAAWIQDFSTKEVLQAESADITGTNSPIAPVVLSPRDGQGVQNGLVKIKWTSPSSTIRLQVSNRVDFLSIVLDETVTGTEYTVAKAALSAATTYYVRARVTNASGGSDWSVPTAFAVQQQQSGSFQDLNNNLCGGDCTSIVQDPTSPRIMYAAVDGGGVYRSDDEGATWIKRSVGLESLAVRSLVVDRHGAGTVVAGTAGGVYVSHDSGASWVNCGLSDVNTILVTASNVTYAISGGTDLSRSPDFGATWAAVTPVFTDYSWLNAVAVDPNNQDRVLLSGYSSKDYLPFLYSSQNAGGSWNRLPLTDVQRYEYIEGIVFDQSSPQVVYLADSSRGLWKSTDSGNSFTLLPACPEKYLDGVLLDPANPATIYVRGGSTLYASNDRGASWRRLYSGDSISSLLVDSACSGSLFVSTNSNDGVLHSTDTGVTWNASNKGIEGLRIVGIIAGSSVSTITNGGMYWLSSGSWSQPNRQTSSSIDRVFVNPSNYQEFVCDRSGWSIDYTGDGGKTYSSFSLPQNTYLRNSACLDVDFHSKVIYALVYHYSDATYHLYKSGFAGSWQEIQSTGADVGHVGCVTVDPTSQNIVYLGLTTYSEQDASGNWSLKGGGLSKSLDAGQTFKAVVSDQISVQRVFIDPKDSQKVYASTDTGFERSTDGGLSFAVVTSAQAGMVVFDTKLPTIYAAQGRSIMKSDDDGKTWQYIGWDYALDMVRPSTVTALAIARDDANTVFIGTDGCGVYKYAITAAGPVQYTITATAGEGGTISPSGAASVNGGADQMYSIGPSAGHHVQDVLVDGQSVGTVLSYAFQAVAANHAISATFALDSYTIIASAGAGGSISPSGTVPQQAGGSLAFTIAPNVGYHIKDVRVDGLSVGTASTYAFSAIAASHTIEAVFEKNGTVIVLRIGSSDIMVNGHPGLIDAQGSTPIIKNGRTLVPIRAVVEALGGTVDWISQSQGITIVLHPTIIGLQIGSATAVVNGRIVSIDPANSNVVPEIIGGRTMLPLRFVGESLGAQIEWDGATQTITITYLG